MKKTFTQQKAKKNIPDIDYRFGFAMPERSFHKSKSGLNAKIVEEISQVKKEEPWMRDFRLSSYETFLKKPMPPWGADLSGIDFDALTYYLKATGKQSRTWEDLPKEIKETYDRIGVPEAEKKFLAGVSAQYESEVVYESINKKLSALGVIFCDMDTAVRKYPKLVKEYFGKLIPPHDNKFAALNSAVWSGGSFVYVPKGVKVDLPLQAYFRINSEAFGQFERTLIIAEEGSYVHYTEGCTAPIYSTKSLHSAVVEIFVKKKRPRPLHHRPKLEQEHLQSCHEAGESRGKRRDGMDRLQHRKQGYHEISGGLFSWQRRSWRSTVHRLRRSRPAPGCGSQNGASRARYHFAGYFQIHLQRRRPHFVSRSRPYSLRCYQRSGFGRLRCPPPG